MLVLIAVTDAVLGVTWSWDDPSAIAVRDPDITVMCSGGSDDTVERDLLIRVYCAGTFRNHGDGDYTPGPGAEWEGDVAPPVGGFNPPQGGENVQRTATGRLWLSTQNPDTENDIAHGDWTWDVAGS